VSALLDRAGPFGFPLTVAEIKLAPHGPLICPPVLSAIQAKTIGPNAGGERKWVAQSEGGQAAKKNVSVSVGVRKKYDHYYTSKAVTSGAKKNWCEFGLSVFF